MNARRRLAALLAALLLTCSLAAKALALPERDEKAALGASVQDGPKLTAACAALLEARTGRVLYTINADRRASMASTTKVMTALLAIETGKLDELVDVPGAAVGVEGSNVYLASGERLSLNDLLYGLMLASGNDAAVTIATHIGGSVADFARQMNARAAELGCVGTHFVNPNGLPDEAHYTTALDLARIAAAAMQNETFRTIVGTTYHQTATGDRARTFKNKNRILWEYDGGNGVKTGFTKAAGRCLVFSAERDGMTLVGVVLDAPDMWNDARALLDYGFHAVENRLLIDAAVPLGTVAVRGGASQSLAVYPERDVRYPLAKDGGDAVEWEIVCADALTAPVQAGQKAGAVRLIVNGNPALEVPLIVTESTSCARVLDELKEILRRWSA